MTNSNTHAQILEKAISGFAENSSPEAPALLVFSTGTSLPPCAIPMLRTPPPPTGVEFGAEYFGFLSDVVLMNAAVHDGAAVFVRGDQNSPYLLRDWSCRLFPPDAKVCSLPNRGSAFNSGLAMSVVEQVDTVILRSGSEIWAFKSGTATLVGDR